MAWIGQRRVAGQLPPGKPGWRALHPKFICAWHLGFRITPNTFALDRHAIYIHDFAARPFLSPPLQNGQFHTNIQMGVFLLRGCFLGLQKWKWFQEYYSNSLQVIFRIAFVAIHIRKDVFLVRFADNARLLLLFFYLKDPLTSSALMILEASRNSKGEREVLSDRPKTFRLQINVLFQAVF